MSEYIEETKKLLVEKNLTYAGQLSFLAYTTRLEEENQQLKAKLEMYENGVYYSSENDKLKEVIEEVREIIEKGLDFDNPYYADKCEEELLQILDKVKENK